MLSINPDAQRALTEKRGKELDRWIEMKCIRFMRGIEPYSLTFSDLPTEIIHQVVEKMEPVEILSSREVCRSMRNVVNKFVLPFGGILLFWKNNKVSEQVSPTFSGMPTKIINQVVEKMQPIDRLRASKVCRSWKTAVDKFGLRFGYNYLILRKDNIEMGFGGTKAVYNTAKNKGTNVKYNGKETLSDGENFVQRAAKDFKIVSKHARKIEIRNETKDGSDIVTTFTEFLCTKKCILVEEIKLRNFSSDEVLKILPCLDAKVLKKLELGWMKSIDQFKRITHLEQWVNAEELRVSKIVSTMMVHFFHFKCFYIYTLDKFSAQTAIQMRDDLMRRSKFQNCNIYFEKSDINPMEIAKVFKPDYAGNNEFQIEYSNGLNKFAVSLENLKFSPTEFQLNMRRL